MEDEKTKVVFEPEYPWRGITLGTLIVLAVGAVDCVWNEQYRAAALLGLLFTLRLITSFKVVRSEE